MKTKEVLVAVKVPADFSESVDSLEVYAGGMMRERRILPPIEQGELEYQSHAWGQFNKTLVAHAKYCRVTSDHNYNLFVAESHRLYSLIGHGDNTAAAPEVENIKPAELTDDALRDYWRAAGGNFFGPITETGSMPESILLPLLRHILMTKAPEVETSETAPDSLLRNANAPLPKGCYCTLGKCAAPKPGWCRDPGKRDSIAHQSARSEHAKPDDLQQIINALERSARDNESHAAELIKLGDYRAEFPASDAQLIRRAVDMIATSQFRRGPKL